MKYLGIDYGTKRVGIAVSDELGRLAFPKVVLDNSGLEKLIEGVKKIITFEKIEAIVVGDSKNFKFKDNPIMEDINLFIEKLKKETDLEIHLQPEFMSSVQAENLANPDFAPFTVNSRMSEASRTTVRHKRNKAYDAAAAAIILQSYLDSNK